MSHSSEDEDNSSISLSPSRFSEQGSTMSLRSWTIPKITAELRRRGIPFSATARKAELFRLLCSKSSPSSEDNVTLATINNSLLQLHVMLNSLLASLNDVQHRLEVVEARTTTSPIAVSSGKTSIVPGSQVCIGSSISTPVLTKVHFVPESIKQDILNGKEFNLASLLIDYRDVLENECFSFGEVSVIMKAKDPRLNRKLNISEFVLAFSIFRDVLCSVNPGRREELDQYLYTVVDLGYKYGGFMFYDHFQRKPLPLWHNSSGLSIGPYWIQNSSVGTLQD
ncbi:uncharacterized protein LOC130362568 [Hyla sarda]|uniref:uncharacterized protein LOC130362568 n=1 Tax=Hyla sarda TaxID=327740 RepID=UPI0024C2E6EB|nr:uncharacterized protein LOC130362568 [Hyla sarda]